MDLDENLTLEEQVEIFEEIRKKAHHYSSEEEYQAALADK